jgi:hypothetical protein
LPRLKYLNWAYKPIHLRKEEIKGLISRYLVWSESQYVKSYPLRTGRSIKADRIFGNRSQNQSF